jgi:TonB family protein
MIKTCPACNRTYSDETISFCLADGALLSAPYDTAQKQAADRDIEKTGAPTEFLPPQFVPTQAVVEAKGLPTITAALPTPPRQTMREVAQPSSKRPLVLAILAFILVSGALVLSWFAITRRSQKSDQAATTSPNPGIVIESSASPTPGVQRPSPTPAVSVSPARNRDASPSPKNLPDSPKPATLDADPVLFPPDRKTTDYNKVFSSNEADQPARILSKPQPSYTDAARQNQISGVVVLRVVFSSAGAVTNITVVRGLPDGLSEQAIAAARQIKFEPAKKDGRPVSMYMQIQYNFNLY